MTNKNIFPTANFINVHEVAICVFDILGATSLFNSSTSENIIHHGNMIYKSFYESSCFRMNQFQKIAVSYPNNCRSEFLYILDLISKFSHIEFYGDTLVFITALHKIPSKYKLFAYDFVIILAADITRKMFEYGLPIRGCIDCGLIGRTDDSMMIIGSPYVNSVKQSNSLEFSGTIVSENFMSAIENLKVPSFDNIVLVDIQFKDGDNIRTTKRPCVDWLAESIFLQPQCDIEREVELLFSAHNKSLNPSAMRKVKNTSAIIRQLISRHNRNCVR